MTAATSSPVSRCCVGLLLVAACGKGGDDTPSVPDSPIFETHIVPIFGKSCGSSNPGCHHREAFNTVKSNECRGWLSLEDAPLGSVFYAGATTGTPTGCPDMVLYDRLLTNAWMCGAPVDVNESHVAYVVPCNPEASLLYRVMGNGPLCSQMLNFMPPRRKADVVETETIYRWIANGTPRLDGSAIDCGNSSGQ